MFDRNILHFDGDSFFASVEQALDWRLKGKPLVTGGERGAITSASLEAKRIGIGRGLTLREAKKLCPELIVVSGDYLSYSIFAERMYTIVRDFTPIVEEYSIDECFADITGLDRVFKMSHEDIALAIKKKLEESLGLTFGVGLGPNKVLAKVASKHQKPAGFTVIKKENLKQFLKDLPLGKVWGIGPSTSITLSKAGVFTALQFAQKTKEWIEHYKISKPYREIWLELHGYYAKELSLEYETPHSIIKSRTFRPPSSSRDYIFSELSKNIEAACFKARRHGVRVGEFRFYLKTQEFTYHGLELKVTIPTSSPTEILKIVEKYFDKVWRPGVIYRATGISFRMFTKEEATTSDLFGKSKDTEKQIKMFQAVDQVSNKFGDHSIYLGSSAQALGKKISSHKKVLDIPILGSVR